MTTTRILLFILAAGVSRAQTPRVAVSLADAEQRTLTSTKIGQRYELLVSLPEGYAKSGEAYPVLYVLDGIRYKAPSALADRWRSPDTPRLC